MDEELTTEELMDLRVILIRFLSDKEAHKKIPRIESRAPKLWDKVDRMYFIDKSTFVRLSDLRSLSVYTCISVMVAGVRPDLVI
jgi:hypothetical protein